MLLEHINPDLNVQLLFGLGLGLLFGIAAQVSRFCLRRSVAGEDGADRAGLAVWLLALATAIIGVQWATGAGYAVLDSHRFLSNDIPVAAILLGGLMFGAGMVLTRGCVTRLTVLSATGNLRALLVLLVFAITAHAMMKGVLAPLRTGLSAPTIDLPLTTLSVIPGAAFVLPLILLAAVVWLARAARPKVLHLVMGVVIGLLVAAGWVGTSTLLMDDFDPTPVQSVAFTLPWADSLFWVITSSAVPAGFGPGLIGGVFVGAFVSAALRKELSLVSFTDGPQTLRYIAGGALMGVGGVLAGGCTTGAGLSGVSALSIAAMIALAGMVAGAVATRQVLVGKAGVTATA